MMTLASSVSPIPNDEWLLNMSKEEFLNLMACIPTLNERCHKLESNFSTLNQNYSSLQNNYTILEQKCKQIENENCDLKNQLAIQNSSTSKQINKTNQYSRRNSLLAHLLRKVPTNLHGTAFSKYVAKELCRIMPKLTITHYDIDTAHVLYYEYIGNRRLPVVVIKFLRRDLRNDILHYGNYNPIHSDAFFTEHLTMDNRKLFDSASEKYAEVWTEQCRIFAYDDVGKKKEIVEESDLPPQRLNDIPSGSGNPDVHGPVEAHSVNSSPHTNVDAPHPRNNFQAGRRKYRRRSNHRSKKRYSKPSNRQFFNSQALHLNQDSILYPNSNPSTTTQRNVYSTDFNFYSGERQNSLNARHSAMLPTNTRNAPMSSNLATVPEHFNPQSAPFSSSSTISGVNTIPLNNSQLSSHQSNYNNNTNYLLPRGFHHNISRPRFPVFNPARPPPGFAW